MTNDSLSIAPLQQRMSENCLSQQSTAEQNAATLDKSMTSLTRQLAIKRGLQASHRPVKKREARIAYVHNQVEAGVYHVDSTELAERLLWNWTHFLDATTDE